MISEQGREREISRGTFVLGLAGGGLPLARRRKRRREFKEKMGEENKVTFVLEILPYRDQSRRTVSLARQRPEQIPGAKKTAPAGGRILQNTMLNGAVKHFVQVKVLLFPFTTVVIILPA